MKKILLLLITITLLVPGFCFASDGDSGMFEINMLLDNNKLDTATIYQISNMASELSSTERMILLNQNEKSAWGPFALNFVLGLGIGSYVQGNSTVGTIGLVGELLAYSMILSSTTVEGVSLGTALLLGTRLVEMISPFTFASSYNKKLNQSLVGVGVTAIPILSEEGMGVKLAASIKF